MASSWTVWGEFPTCGASDAAFCCNELSESSGGWWSAIFSMVMRHLRCSLACNCLVPLSWGSKWFNVGLQLWLPELDFNLNQAWTPAYTHVYTGHLALLSISAATRFINQTNLEVINCPHQTDTHARRHTLRALVQYRHTRARSRSKIEEAALQSKRKPRPIPSVELMLLG